MPEWMRSQFMAPAYALLISLAVALVLGFSMKPADEQKAQPETQTTPTTEPASIRVGVREKNDEPQKPTWVTPDDLVGVSVTIQRVDSGEFKVGKDGAIPRTFFTEPVRVCLAELPEKWEGVNVEKDSTPQAPCWKVDPKNGPFNLEVRKGG